MSNSVVKLLIIISFMFLFNSASHAQGDNNPDPLVNLALIDSAIVSGSLPANQARGIPENLLWDPATGHWATESDLHEYGMLYDSIAYKTKDDPLWWQVVWPTAKNINFITCAGSYPDQPQPTTGWAVQIMVDSSWQDLAKANNGWAADTLTGAGVGIPTQTNWLWDGQLVWKGLEPVVTAGVRFTAYSNPDSLADGKESFADSLWSFAWSGRQIEANKPKSVLIQYLDFSQEEADNKIDPLVNLALLDEAMVSASFVESTYFNERNQPVDILYDPLKDDYHNITLWGEFGYPYQYEVGFPEEGQYSDPPAIDDAFYWQAEWPVLKKINYVTWGGGYGGTPQSETPWALQYWDGEAWQTLIDGVGGSWYDYRTQEYDSLHPYTPGVDAYAQSIWIVPIKEAISTTKIRLAAWSDGINLLWSFVIRCRGGVCINNDDSDNPFKAVLVQYAEIHDPTALEANNFTQPNEFVLHQNYPNPFNPQTMINYQLSMISDVELAIYNLMGQKVATLVSEKQNAGLHKVQWDAKGFASGIYIYQLKANPLYSRTGGQRQRAIFTKKMVLLK